MMYCVNCEYPVTYEEKMANRCSHCGKHPDHEQKATAAVKDLPDSNLAFEQAFPVDAPEELWRLSAVRTHKGEKEIRHINWFSTEAAALAHRDWINDGRGRVLSIVKYRSC